jgi:hypothetical protein
LKINKTSAIFGGMKGLAAGLISVENVKTVIETVQNTGSETATMFKKARENARITGKILGHYLGLGVHFDSFSISLIGFSLGSQVIKSCLNTIAKLDLP